MESSQAWQDLPGALALYHTEGLTGQQLCRLFASFGCLSNALQAEDETLLALGISPGQLAAAVATSKTDRVRRSVSNELAWAFQSGNAIVIYGSEQYPGLLYEIANPPPILYLKGQHSVLNSPQVAMVGSRKSSQYGDRNAFWLGCSLAEHGVHVTSGLAQGIDTQSHEGALYGNGKTIAVMGCGLNTIYPRGNEKLARRIMENGVLVSEFWLESTPLPSHFPRRNRIISGLSMGTIVVEATASSGSLITARYAVEQNREVFALPGPIGSQSTRGCHELIKAGAKLVEEPEDVISELGFREAG